LQVVKVNEEPKANSGTAAAVVSAGPAAPASPPDPEVVERPKRRSFTAEYKRQVLEEADRCGPGEIGALLRREGLYSSHLTTWRTQREAGTLAGLAPKKRGRKAEPKNLLADRVAQLERENRRLLARAERAEGIVEVQKKLAQLIGVELPPEPPKEKP
jgi:transposase-like protein